MPKVTGPMMSIEASGDLAQILNFHKRPGGFAVAKHHHPGSVVTAHKEPNDAQTVIRGYYTEAVSHWKMLSEEEKQDWRDFVAS